MRVKQIQLFILTLIFIICGRVSLLQSNPTKTYYAQSTDTEINALFGVGVS